MTRNEARSPHTISEEKEGLSQPVMLGKGQEIGKQGKFIGNEISHKRVIPIILVHTFNIKD